MRQVAPCLKSYVEEKRVQGPLLERLCRLGEAELGPLIRIIELTNPSGNTLRETLRTADEISKRDGVPLNEIIGSGSVTAILEADGFSRKEKQKQLRLHLERQRYPVFAQIEDRLNECQKRILAKTGLKLEYPEDLEGDQASLQLRARSPQDFVKLGEALLRLGADGDCAEFFAVLKGEV